MPDPFQDPHIPPAFVEPADATLLNNRNVRLDPATDLTLHNVQFDGLGQGTLSAVSARTIAPSLLRAASVPLIDPSTNTVAEPSHLFHHRVRENFSTLSELHKKLEALGIERAEVFIAVKPGQEYALLTTSGEFFNQSFEADRTGFSYTVQGESVQSISDWITNGRGEFSSVRMWTDGRDIVFTPAYTLPRLFPGVSTTLSSNVTSILKSTNGMRPQYEHMLSGDPNNPTAGVPVGSGRFTFNQFGAADSLVSTFDFRGGSIDSSLYLGTGFNGYNFVAFRGCGNLFGGTAQADALFAQSVAGGSGIGGALSFSKAFESTLVRFSVGAYRQFEALTGEFSPGVGAALGVEPNAGDYGMRFGFEILR